MKRFTLVVALLLVVCPGVAWGVAEQLTATRLTLQNTKDGAGRIISKEAMLIRCDEVPSITTSGPLGGESCESGDWSVPIDCRGFSNVNISYYEYGTGSGEAKLWNCKSIQTKTEQGTASDGSTNPGVVDPTGGPTSPADPDPLCVDLTASAGVTLLGTAAANIFLNLSGQSLGFLIGEIEDCTGNCDSTLIVSCSQ